MKNWNKLCQPLRCKQQENMTQELHSDSSSEYKQHFKCTLSKPQCNELITYRTSLDSFALVVD